MGSAARSTSASSATIKDGIKQGNGFFYAPEARSWITEYPAEAVPAAELVYPETLLVTMRQGIVILSQKCPHLGVASRVQDQPVVRVPVPRLAVQPRR